jgi:phosphate transport system substrate-binding protein
MKQKFFKTIITACAIMTLASCGSTSSNNASTLQEASFDTTKEIKVYTRDTNSGTRDGFMSKIGFDEAVKDNSVLVNDLVEATGNGDMMQKIQNDEYGIGYISLSTLDDSGCKGLSFENVVPSKENVINGTYGLYRDFNYCIRTDFGENTEVGEIVQAFVAFLSTAEAKATMLSEKGILELTGDEPTWASIKNNYPIALEDNSSYTVRFGGSTSVEDMSIALTDQFSPLCGNFIANHNHLGSGSAYKGTQGEANDLDVGFLSREIKLTSSEPAAADSYGKLCIDAIVAIVNEVNTYASTDAATLKAIYSGEKKIWSDVIA